MILRWEVWNGFKAVRMAGPPCEGHSGSAAAWTLGSYERPVCGDRDPLRTATACWLVNLSYGAPAGLVQAWSFVAIAPMEPA
jgi:hypothetical protein